MTESGEPMAAAVMRLEQCFRDVYQTRMQDLPIVNRVLEVRAMGFRQWHEYWFGALLTPWFINLVLLPRENTTAMPEVGGSCRFAFPAGEFVFLGCHEESTGQFLSCSLLSPVNGVDSQQQAETIIEEALKEIFEERPAETSGDEESKEVRRFQVNAAIMSLTAEDSSNEIAGGESDPGKRAAIEGAGNSDTDCRRKGADYSNTDTDYRSTESHSNDYRRINNKDTDDERASPIIAQKMGSKRNASQVRTKSSLVSNKERMSRRRLFARMVGRGAVQQENQEKLEDTDRKGAQR